MKRGLMSFESVFSLAILIIFISSLSILKPNYLDTSLYEYQLLNDILEITEKNSGIERLSNGDITVILEMQEIAQKQGYCLDITLELIDRTIPNMEDEFIIINQTLYIELTFPSLCEERVNKVSTTRTIPAYLGEIIVLEAKMWKQ
ncbi:hypothetical protein KO317_00980 [Candidatus Micrarchaeota archaeon]|jgi:hypothetical protein|nr:hypothetical protein [Candidatus Micrarchaeota archaeon]